MQGPNALEVLEKVNGGPLPEIKFFNMGEITIAGRKVRALHHGMSGVPGLELFGPWDEGDEVKAAIVEAGEEFGLAQVGSRVYATNTLESGWIPCPLPAVFTGDDMKAYREWLPATGYEGTGSLGGSYYSDDIADYYLTPYELGYGSFVKFDHDFIGREALEAMAAEPPRQEGDARLERRRCHARDGNAVPEGGPGEVHRPAALQLLDLAERQDHEGRQDGRRARHSRATARTRARCSRSRSSTSTVAEPGTEVTLVWGEEGGGSAKPVVERHVQTEIRAIVSPVPYAEVVRASYRPQLAMAEDAELLGLYWTVSGPVDVHFGREWSLFELGRPLRRGAEGRLQPGSGSGTPTSSTCSRHEASREMKQASTTTASRHLELEFLMDWFLDPGDERRQASDQIARPALRRRRRARRASHQGREHPRRTAASLSQL